MEPGVNCLHFEGLAQPRHALFKQLAANVLDRGAVLDVDPQVDHERVAGIDPGHRAQHTGIAADVVGQGGGRAPGLDLGPPGDAGVGAVVDDGPSGRPQLRPEPETAQVDGPPGGDDGPGPEPGTGPRAPGD